MRLVVTRVGATTEFDCAHGTIDERIVLSRNGKFSVRGTHVFEHGGPVRLGEKAKIHSAHFTGRLLKDKLTVTITLIERKEVVGTFTLTLGEAAVLYKCL